MLNYLKYSIKYCKTELHNILITRYEDFPAVIWQKCKTFTLCRPPS